MKFSITIKLLFIFLLSFFFISNSSAQWQKTNGIKGGYFQQVAGDGENLLALTNYGSIFHYNNGEWNFMSSFAYFTDIFNIEDKWIGYSSSAISVSKDNGITWEIVLNQDNTNYLADVKVIDEKIYALTSDSIFFSDDIGTSWSVNELSDSIATEINGEKETGFVYSIMSFHVKDNLLLAAGFTTLPSHFEAVLCSTDMGSTWQLTNFPDENFNLFIFDIIADENSFYASSSNGFFRSEDGINWTEMNDGLGFEGSSLSVNELEIYKGSLIAAIGNTPSGLYRYNGTTWKIFYSEGYPVSLSPYNDILFFCSEGDVKKFDGDTNWMTLTSDIIASTSKPVTSGNGSVFSIYKNQLYRTTDGGTNWNNIHDVGNSIIVNEDTLYTISPGQIERSYNMGDDWSTITSGIPGTYVQKLSSIGLANKKLYAGFNGTRPRKHLPAVWEQGGIYVSTNNGDSWSQFNTGLPTEGGVPAPVYTITADGEIIILYTAAGRYSLINNSWVNISNGFPDNSYISNTVIFQDDIVFLTNAGFFISHDKGITKEDFNTGLPELPYYQILVFIYQETLYTFSNDNPNKVYKHTGTEWVEADFPLPGKVRFTSFQAVDDIIYAGTYDNGIWKYDPASLSNDDVQNTHSYSLSQNYPNPFNPATKINFHLADGGSVQLKIYDILGKEVMTLINELKPSGQYEIEFDASSLPSGVYFYRIVTSNFSETKKMILLR